MSRGLTAKQLQLAGQIRELFDLFDQLDKADTPQVHHVLSVKLIKRRGDSIPVLVLSDGMINGDEVTLADYVAIEEDQVADILIAQEYDSETYVKLAKTLQNNWPTEYDGEHEPMEEKVDPDPRLNYWVRVSPDKLPPNVTPECSDVALFDRLREVQIKIIEAAAAQAARSSLEEKPEPISFKVWVTRPEHHDSFGSGERFCVYGPKNIAAAEAGEYSERITAPMRSLRFVTDLAEANRWAQQWISIYNEEHPGANWSLVRVEPFEGEPEEMPSSNESFVKVLNDSLNNGTSPASFHGCDMSIPLHSCGGAVSFYVVWWDGFKQVRKTYGPASIQEALLGRVADSAETAHILTLNSVFTIKEALAWAETYATIRDRYCAGGARLTVCDIGFVDQ